MPIEIADRLKGTGEYYFSQKLREIEQLNKSGEPVINLGIGSPDRPPHPDVVKTLQEESAKPNVHGYQNYKGVLPLRKAISDWYKKWYAVNLDADTEILPLIGSKEGIMHVCMTYINPGDVVLIPNPGYPTYRSAATIAGATIVEYHLKEENNWFPDFEAIEKSLSRPSGGGSPSPALPEGKRETVAQPPLSQDAAHNSDPSKSEVSAAGGPFSREGSGMGRRVLMFVNYPHMPTGQVPTKALFESLVAFAKKHHILICHDNPYSFILNDHPVSLLSVDGAKEVVIELNSLSKSHNMAGWRVGMLCGARQKIDEVLRFKSNMDSDMFLPLQLAAVKALTLDKTWHDELNTIYKKRREKVFQLLDELECAYSKDQVGLFVWAKIPETYSTGFELSDEVLQKTRVFITPGGIFGSEGTKYIRVSLCSTEEKYEEALNRISKIPVKA